MKFITQIIMLVSVIGFTLGNAHAQTVYKNYQDGSIWFKIKSNYHPAGSVKAENPKNLALNRLPFIADLAEKYQITDLSRPFYMAKHSQALQHTYLIRFKNITAVNNLIKALEATGDVDYAEKVPLSKLFLTPNDPYYPSSSQHAQWYLHKINAAQAWDYAIGNPAIVVADVDNAIDVNHAELQANMVAGRDVADNDNSTLPPNANVYHGTFTSGLISGVTNNGVGIAAIGYNLSVMPIKVASDANPTSIGAAGFTGITYAANHGARVINCSWGGPSYSQTGQNVINDAWNQGAIIVCAAGDSHNSTKNYPAAYDHAYSVAGTDANDHLGPISTYGTWVKISAPGDNITGLHPDNMFMSGAGTSAASPIVAGLCGLILSLDSNLTNQQVLDCITNTAVNIDGLNSSYAGKLGAGRIDAAAAMAYADSLSTPPTSIAAVNPTHATLSVFYNQNNETTIMTLKAVPDGNYQLYLFDGNGRRIFQKTVTVRQPKQQFSLDMSSYGNGIYFVRLVGTQIQLYQKAVKY